MNDIIKIKGYVIKEPSLLLLNKKLPWINAVQLYVQCTGVHMKTAIKTFILEEYKKDDAVSFEQFAVLICRHFHETYKNKYQDLARRD